MKISELIQTLQEIQAKHGDLSVSVSEAEPLLAVLFLERAIEAAQGFLRYWKDVMADPGMPPTPDQETMIRELVEAGRTQEAQSIILERLDQEFS